MVLPAPQDGDALVVELGADVVGFRRRYVDDFQEGAGDEDDVGRGGLGGYVQPGRTDEEDLVRGVVRFSSG